MENVKATIDDAVYALQHRTEYLDRVRELAKLFESVPGITVKYPTTISSYYPGSYFMIQGPVNNKALYVDDVFQADENRLLKNLKARVRRYNSAMRSQSANPYSNRPGTIFTKE